MKKIKLFLLLLGVLCLVGALFGCGGPPVEPIETTEDEAVKTFEITDEFFVLNSYEITTQGPDGLGEEFSLFRTNTINVYSKCLSSLNEVSAVIDFYNATGKLVGTYRASLSADIPANTEFALSADISDNVRDSFEVIKVKYSGVTESRDAYRVNTFYYNITYVFNNGDAPKMEVVEWRTLLKEPEIPQKDGYDFDGWFTDPECTQRFDFENTKVSDDIVLYAAYALDYIRMGQMVQAKAANTSVKIITKSYTSLVMGMIEITSHEKEGEGVIIKDGSGYYYVLTTDDLVEKRKGYENVSYTVLDSYGHAYKASLKHSSVGYNLAVLYFEKGERMLEVAPMANVPPKIGENIAIASFTERGVAPSFGEVLTYERILHSDIGSNAGDIRFDMMVHNAQTDVKISGRPVFSMELGLVGIQCGTLSEEAVEYENSHVIPLEAIRKYLDTYGL